MAIKLRRRFTTSGSINLDGREESVSDSGGQGNPSSYAITISIIPGQLQPNESASLVARVTVNGVGHPNQLVSFSSTASGVGAVPATATTASDGTIRFGIIGQSVGTATISASFVVAGTTYQSNAVAFVVSTQPAPINAAATGYGRVVASVETPLANAIRPRLQRMSHAEQQRKFKDDDGLQHAVYFETATIVITPKALQAP